MVETSSKSKLLPSFYRFISNKFSSGKFLNWQISNKKDPDTEYEKNK